MIDYILPVFNTNIEWALDCEFFEREVFKIDLSYRSPSLESDSSDSGSSNDESDEEECVDKNLINPHRPTRPRASTAVIL